MKTYSFEKLQVWQDNLNSLSTFIQELIQCRHDIDKIGNKLNALGKSYT